MADIAYKPISDYKGAPPPHVSSATPQIIQTSSLNDYIALRGELLVLSTVNTGAGVGPTLLIVPEGYTFFLTSASIASTTNLAAGADSCFHVYLKAERHGGASPSILAYHYTMGSGLYGTHNISQTLSPQIPLAFPSPTYFYVYQQSSQITTDACMQGYLVKNTEIPAIL